MPREDSVVICSPQTGKNSEDSHEDEDNDDEVFNNTKIILHYTTKLLRNKKVEKVLNCFEQSFEMALLYFFDFPSDKLEFCCL